VPSHPRAPSGSGGKRGSKGTEVSNRQAALYALPLGEFVRSRDALARELASEGKSKEASETKKLKRATVPAWIVNRLAHRHPEKIEALLAAGSALEHAHRRVLSGLGAQALKEASRDFQRALDALVTEASTTLTEAGRAASGEPLRQVEETLRAASLGSQEDRTALSRGMLTRPLRLAGSGFGELSALLLVGAEPRVGASTRATTKAKGHRPATAPEPAEPAPSSRGGVVLRGPWTPRADEAEAPPTRQGRAEDQARRKRAEALEEQRRARELERRRRAEALEEERREKKLARQRRAEELEEHRRATQLDQRKRAEELDRRKREAQQELKRAETAEQRALREAERAGAALAAAQEKTRQTREALERAEEAERTRAEALTRARTQARTAGLLLSQARRHLQDAESRPHR
jgi:hypothetical protein